MKRSDILMILMGALMMIVGIGFLIKYGISQPNPGLLPANILLIIAGGAIILILRKRTRLCITVGLAATGMSAIISNIYYIGHPTDILTIILSTIYVVAGIVIIYYALALIFIQSPSSTKGVICLSVMATAAIGPALYFTYLDGDLIGHLSKDIDAVINGLLHLMLIVIITRKDVKLDTISKRLDTNSSDLFRQMGTPSDAYMDFRSLKMMDAGCTEGWIRNDDAGYSETTVTLYGAPYDLILQRWDGYDDLFLVIGTGRQDSFMTPLSFPVTHTATEFDETARIGKIRFYGKDGMFIDILIADHESEKKGYIGTIRAYGKHAD